MPSLKATIRMICVKMKSVIADRSNLGGDLFEKQETVLLREKFSDPILLSPFAHRPLLVLGHPNA